MFENEMHQKRERKGVEKQDTKEKRKKSWWKQLQKKSQLKPVEKRQKSKAKGNRLKQYNETRSGVTITCADVSE